MPEQFTETRALPPHNLEAEQALLGACLLNKEAVNEALEYVRAEDFYGENHRLIFECMQKLVVNGSPCDMVTVSDALNTAGNLERVGGMAYIAALPEAAPAATAAAYYAKIVFDKAVLRAIIEATSRITQDGYSGGYESEELMELAERAIFEISERRQRGTFYAIRDLVMPVFEDMGRIKASDGVTGVPTFRDLDKLLSGLQKSDLILLAARPACGKTSMALNVAQRAAVKHGRRVAIFSLEMPKEQLVQRMLCTQAEVDQGRVRKGQASAEDFGRLSKALVPLSNAEIYIDDTASVTVSEIRSKCRKLKLEKKGLDLIVIDYIQLIQSAGSRRVESRQQEVAEFSRSLKGLAKELDVPVLALSQLSRLAERSNEPPNLSHLRESGALEQDADVVMMLHQQRNEGEMGDDTPIQPKDQTSDIVQVIVAKHRNGPVGEAELLFRRNYTSFEDIAYGWQADEAPPPLPSEPPPFDL